MVTDWSALHICLLKEEAHQLFYVTAVSPYSGPCTRGLLAAVTLNIQEAKHEPRIRFDCNGNRQYTGPRKGYTTAPCGGGEMQKKISNVLANAAKR